MRLSDNAFYLLGASPYEQKYRIIDKCEDKLFEEDDNGIDYEAQQNILLSPVKRLSEEIRWFFSEDLDVYERVKDNVALYENAAFEMQSPLAKINLLVYSMMEGELSRPLHEVVLAIDAFYDDIDYEAVLEEINEVREVAGISDIKEVDQIEKEIERLRDDIRQAFQYVAKEIYSLCYMEDALKVAEETYNCGQYSDIATEFLGMYHLDIQNCINDTQAIIQSLFSSNRGISCGRLLDIVGPHFKEICELEAPLIEYYSIHDIMSASKEVFEQLREVSIDQLSDTNIQESVYFIETLRQLCISNSKFVEQLDTDLSQLGEFSTIVQYNEYSIQLNAMIEHMQREVLYEFGHESRTLSFYNDYFLPHIVVLINKIFSTLQLSTSQKEELAGVAAYAYLHMAWGLAYARNLKLAKSNMEVARTYAHKTNNREVIHGVEEQYESIKKYYNEIGDTIDSSSYSSRASSSSSRSSSYTSSGSSSSSSSDTGCGCFIAIIILAVASSVGGPIGFFIGLAILGYFFNDK